MPRPADWNRRDLLKILGLAAPAAAFAAPAAKALDALAQTAPAPTGAQPAAPPPGAAERGPLKKVVVAGAGLAGLAAAWELVNLGHDVTVLEARTRPGGRVYTVREPFADGLYADAGGMDFSDAYRQYLRYVKVFNLSAAPVAGAPLATVYHLRGTRFEVKPQRGAAPPPWPYKLTPEEAKLGVGGMFGKFFGAADALGDPTAPDFRIDAVRKFDAMTLGAFLAAQGASPDAVEMLGKTLWFGFGIDQVSALHRLLSDVALFCMGQQTRALVGGSDMLPRAFAKALGDRIRYSSPVVRVVTHVGSVKVVYGQPGAEQSLEADRLICTLPGPALRKVAFTPALSAPKQQILDRLEYNPVTRIFLQTRRRGWTEAGDSGYAFTDLPIQMVDEQPLVRDTAATPRGIVECHVKGAEAARVAAMEPAARLAFAVEGMEKVYPGFRAQFETGTSVAWGDDPWAGGGYAWWKPGQMTDFVPELMRHEGRVHFAGEHTSWIGRTMEGALESGNRAAHEVNVAPKPISPLADS